MTPRRVRLTATARDHLDLERRWWLNNRDHQELFAHEIERMLEILSTVPAAGHLYTRSPMPGVRRLFLRKLNCHVYYTFDDEQVIVRALWGARRGQGPGL